MTRSTKILVVLFVFSVMVCGSVFASGNKETTATDVKSSENLGVVEQIVSIIGTKLSNMTTTLIYNLHPYPNIMTKFYNLVGLGDASSVNAIEAQDVYNNKFELNSLLLADEYYNNTDSGKVNDIKGGLYIHTANTENQKSRWSLTASLFAMVFAAEVAFTAVMGYVAPQQEGMSLLKELGAKAAKTFLLFILAASLPFLIEGVRYGLFSIADTYAVPEEDNGIQMSTMFEMPEQFMKNMAYLVNKISWRGDASPIFNNDTGGLSSSLLGKLFAGLIYIFFEIFIAMEIIKAGMHILMNIVEVYLLLSCVMILLPFTIFTPSKEMVRGCATSLFMNLIECFILCLIVIIVVPACLNMSQDLASLSNAVSMADTYSVKLLSAEKTNVNTKDVKSGANINYELDVKVTTSNILAMVTWSYEGEPVGLSTSSVITNQGAVAVAFNWADPAATIYFSSNNIDALKPTWSELTPTLKMDTSNGTPSGTNYIFINYDDSKNGYSESEIYANYLTFEHQKYKNSKPENTKTLEEYCNNHSREILSLFSVYSTYDFLAGYWKTIRSSVTDFDSLISLFKEANIKKAMEYYDKGDQNWSGVVARSIRTNSTKIMINKKAAESDETNKAADNDSLISNLVLAWIVIFIPCYFVKQSSQITMGLQRGGVGMESFSNALNAGTAAMKTGFQMTANVIGTAMKGANAIHTASVATNNAKAQKSIVEIMQGNSNPGSNAANNSGASSAPGWHNDQSTWE